MSSRKDRDLGRVHMSGVSGELGMPRGLQMGIRNHHIDLPKENEVMGMLNTMCAAGFNTQKADAAIEDYKKAINDHNRSAAAKDQNKSSIIQLQKKLSDLKDVQMPLKKEVEKGLQSLLSQARTDMKLNWRSEMMADNKLPYRGHGVIEKWLAGIYSLRSLIPKLF